MTDEATLAAIRARHEHDERWRNSPSMICPQSHADRATLLAALDEMRADRKSLEEIIAILERRLDGPNGLVARERALREALEQAAKDLDGAAEDAGRS